MDTDPDASSPTAVEVLATATVLVPRIFHHTLDFQATKSAETGGLMAHLEGADKLDWEIAAGFAPDLSCMLGSPPMQRQ